MPTYEYTCSKCNHTFEVVQPITAKALTVCPQDLCPQKPWGRGKVKRGVGGGAGLIFKGSGFYITDYRSDKYKAAAKKDTTPASSSSSEGTKKEGKGTTTGSSSSTGIASPTPAPSSPKKD